MMERLTKKNWRNLDPWETCGQDNYCKRGCHEQGGCAKGCIVQRIYARLAAYEGTGLEPGDVRRLQQDWTSLIMTLDEMGGMPHLHDLLQAERAGRLVLLPCKVGDHVWADGREAIVVWFFGYKTEGYLHVQFYDNMQYIDIPFAEIGKTVFLTREEAEDAMKEATHA